MGADLISVLQRLAQKIATRRDRAEQDLKKGYVFEPIPNSELSVWFGILRFFTRLIGLNLVPPKRKRNLSESERYHLEEKISELENILTQVNLQLSRAKKNPELRRVPTGLVDYREDGYPKDWEQTSLQYRQKVILDVQAVERMLQMDTYTILYLFLEEATVAKIIFFFYVKIATAYNILI